jgi:hypothetical protein
MMKIVLTILMHFHTVGASTGNGITKVKSTNIFGMGDMSMSMGRGSQTEDAETDNESLVAMKGMGKKQSNEINDKTKSMTVNKESNKAKQTGKMFSSKDDTLTLRIMSYNIWGGGANEGKTVNETVNAILAANPDIVGVQETRLESDPCTAESCPAVGVSVLGEIADALGFYYYDQTMTNVALWSNGVVSRYPILNATKNDLGVMIDVDGEIVYAYNLHLTDFPYQPCTSQYAPF